MLHLFGVVAPSIVAFCVTIAEAALHIGVALAIIVGPTTLITIANLGLATPIATFSF